jgi:hypothetical protein
VNMQETTPATEVEQSSYSEADAAAELLKRWGTTEEVSPEPEAYEESEDQQPEGNADDEPESEETEGEESDDVEIDVGGEKFKLPPVLAEEAKRIESKVKEIEAGATKRFQEAAEIRKVAEAEIQSAKQLQQLAVEQADIIADHKQIMRQLEYLESLDINALAESDPVQLTKVNAQYNQLQSAKQRVEQAYAQAQAKSKEQTEQQMVARLTHLNEFARKSIKGWSDEYSQTLLKFSVNQLGADPEALLQVMSEPVIKALDLAYQGWKVRNTDPKSKQVNATKTLKPGASGQMKSNAQQAVQKAEQRLKKSGSVDDAAMALLARSSVKRR